MVFYWFRLRYDLDCVAGPLGRTTGSDLLSGQHVAASTRLPVVNVVDCGLWTTLAGSRLTFCGDVTTHTYMCRHTQTNECSYCDTNDNYVFVFAQQ